MPGTPKQKAKDLNWSYGLPGERFQKALLDWQVEQLSDEFYRLVNAESNDLLLILKAFDISIPKQRMSGILIRTQKNNSMNQMSSLIDRLSN